MTLGWSTKKAVLLAGEQGIIEIVCETARFRGRKTIGFSLIIKQSEVESTILFRVTADSRDGNLR